MLMRSSLPTAIPELPGPPLRGHLQAFQTDTLGFFQHLHAAARARDADLISFRLGPQRLYYVASATLADEVLAQATTFRQTTLGHKYLSPLIGKSLVLTEAPAHRLHRQQIAPTFRHDRLEQYAAVMVRRADACQATWRPGAALDVAAAMTHLTWEIVTDALFGTTLDAATTEGVRLTLHEALEHIGWQMSHPLALPAALPTARNRRFQANLAYLRATVARVIGAHPPVAQVLQEPAAHRPADLLTLLVAAGVSGPQLADETMTFLLAGHETTATALTWAFYMLARQPAIATRLEAELSTVLAGRLPTYADVPRLPYTTQVFKETLRLYPPVPLLPKQTAAPVTLGPYRMPAGATLMIVPYVLHRDARYWPDPQCFDPGRHDPRAAWRPQSGFLTFSAGERTCIGNNFALLEGVLCLATIVQQVRFTLPPDYRPGPPVLAMTLHAPADLRLTVSPRARATGESVLAL